MTIKASLNGETAEQAIGRYLMAGGGGGRGHRYATPNSGPGDPEGFTAKYGPPKVRDDVRQLKMGLGGSDGSPRTYGPGQMIPGHGFVPTMNDDQSREAENKIDHDADVHELMGSVANGARPWHENYGSGR